MKAKLLWSMLAAFLVLVATTAFAPSKPTRSSPLRLGSFPAPRGLSRTGSGAGDATCSDENVAGDRG